MRLRRVAIGPVKLDRLPKGKARKSSLSEVAAAREAGAPTSQKRLTRKPTGRGDVSVPSRNGLIPRPVARHDVPPRPRCLEHVRLADRTYRLRLECPPSRRPSGPGSSSCSACRGTTDPLLGRPFALYDTVLDATDHPSAWTWCISSSAR